MRSVRHEVHAGDQRPPLQASLAGLDRSAALPSWLPDETLFSLISRYHVLSGNHLASRTCRALFGHPRQGSQHDLPNRLETFCERTSDAVGDPRTLALERTVLPFYLPTRSLAQTESDIRSLAAPGEGVLKFRLGILTSRYRANHPLKACPECMIDDKHEHGAPYWHWEHQLPGVWTCRRHGVVLCSSLLKSTGVERFGWLLPSRDRMQETFRLGAGGSHQEALRRFADLAVAWALLPPETHFSMDDLARTYRSALVGESAKGIDRRVIAVLAPGLCAALETLRTVPELSALPASAEQAGALLTRWTARPRGGTHPLNHLAIIYWLFPSWAGFMSRYEASIGTAPTVTTNATSVSPHGDGRRDALIDLLAHGRSVSGAGRALGVDVQTAAAWAAAAGVAIPRRPKVLKRDAFTDMVSCLRAGMDKGAAASRFNVSRETVTRILRTEVGLHASWHQARFDSAQEAARQTWSAAVSERPGVGLKAVRDLAPAAYAWLYRNDREWLIEASKPTAHVRVAVYAPRIDWDARDRALSADVRQVAANIAEQTGRSRIPLWEIYQVLPVLKAKLGALHRLPLTRRALEEATRRRT